MPSLEVTELYAGYGEVEVLRGASLHVGDAEVVALVGANGAGKSTLINCVSRLVKITGGRILLDGHELSGHQAHALPGLGVVQVPEGRRLFGTLTVEDNLALGAFHARARGSSDKTKDHVFELLPVLAERRTQLAGTLSGGEQQMLAIGRALMAQPRLLMLDEPSLGLAPIAAREMFDLIGAIREAGTSILLVEQNVRQALSLADRAYALQQGRVVLAGTGSELLANPAFTAAMLGLAAEPEMAAQEGAS